MAIPLLKGTYSLDVETVRALEALARRWSVSKSEALRRAIHAAAAAGGPDARVTALERLRKRLALTPAAADAWAQEVRSARRDAGDRLDRLWAPAPRARRVAEPGVPKRK